MKLNPFAVFSALVVLVALGWWGYSTFSESQVEKANEQKDEQRSAERHAKIDAQIAAFVLQYHAISGWEDRLKGSLYSLDLDGAFVNNGGNPIVIRGDIQDVAHHGDKFFLDVDAMARGVSTIRCILECDPVVAKRVTERESNSTRHVVRRVIVVARIDSVERAVLKLTSGVESAIDRETGTEPAIDVDTSDLFWAHGRCLDLILIDRQGNPLPLKETGKPNAVSP